MSLRALILPVVAFALAGAGPVYSPSGYDGADLGEPQAYPYPGSPRDLLPSNVVGYYTRYDRIVPTRVVARAGAVSPFKRAADEIVGNYLYRGSSTLLDYINRNPITALLVAQGDTILFEHYQYARTDTDRFMSQSMVKTIVGMLVGIAVSEGAIHSIDDAASVYVPELAGTEYGNTPIRALLHMASGLRFTETYKPGDDSSKLGRALLGPGARGAVAALQQFDTREAAPGTRWNYAGGDTEVLGLVLSRAVHMTLADYLSMRIWQKLGMEADGAWAVDPTGQEVAYCCFTATLRDWARIAMLLANDGAWHGEQVIPRQWVIDATTVAEGQSYLAPGYLGRYTGYGYQLWLLPRPKRIFGLFGIHGQRIFIDPDAKLVMVQTAVFPEPSAPVETNVVWNALDAAYGNSAGDYSAK